MTSRIPDIYFDTCTLANFAAVGRLDLLEQRYGHRARWTETVQLEVRRGLRAAPYLRGILNAAWLGEPVEITGSTSALLEIDNIRRGLGALPGDALTHLGEAEIIYHLQFVEVGAVFATDDRVALAFARRRGINGLDTRAIIGDCYAMGEVGCPEAFTLLQRMQSNDRGVQVPASHMEICPR